MYRILLFSVPTFLFTSRAVVSSVVLEPLLNRFKLLAKISRVYYLTCWLAQNSLRTLNMCPGIVKMNLTTKLPGLYFCNACLYSSFILHHLRIPEDLDEIEFLKFYIQYCHQVRNIYLLPLCLPKLMYENWGLLLHLQPKF